MDYGRSSKPPGSHFLTRETMMLLYIGMDKPEGEKEVFNFYLLLQLGGFDTSGTMLWQMNWEPHCLEEKAGREVVHSPETVEPPICAVDTNLGWKRVWLASACCMQCIWTLLCDPLPCFKETDPHHSCYRGKCFWIRKLIFLLFSTTLNANQKRKRKEKKYKLFTSRESMNGTWHC